MVEIGEFVEYADQYGEKQSALVTAVHGGNEESNPNPSVNLVIVSKSESETDQYGRQIRRETSVVHQSHQSAHGRYYEQA